MDGDLAYRDILKASIGYKVTLTTINEKYVEGTVESVDDGGVVIRQGPNNNNGYYPCCFVAFRAICTVTTHKFDKQSIGIGG